MNNVSLTGRITKDLTVRYVGADNTALVKFVLAVDRPRKKDQTDFISSVAWGKTAEIMGQYLSKGDKIGAWGRIETDVYEKDGQKVYTTEFVVESFEFLGKKKEEKPEEKAVPAGDDLPFVF